MFKIAKCLVIAKVLCVVGLLSASFLWGSVGGSISGTVKDQTGRVLDNANVMVSEAATGLSYQAHSDNKGLYTFPVLPVGHYELQVQAPGFLRLSTHRYRAGYQRIVDHRCTSAGRRRRANRQRG